jgi:hypothetical protein
MSRSSKHLILLLMIVMLAKPAKVQIRYMKFSGIIHGSGTQLIQLEQDDDTVSDT